MHTILVLMWKHLVVRTRRLINTVVDLLSPLAFFFILYYFRGNINPVHKFSMSEAFTIQGTEPIDIVALPGPTTIFYTPDTDLTGLLMDQVGKSLNLQQKNYSTGNIEKGYVPFANITELLNTGRKFTDSDAVVLFQNMNGTWPKHLNYTIRMRGDFQNEKLNSDDGFLGPHENFGTIYEPFIRLQWAIDSSFIKLLSGDEVKQRVMIQEFPYARFNEQPGFIVVGNIMKFVTYVSLLITFVFVMSKLLEERITGIQELIKMVGVSTATLNLSHFLNMAPVGLVYCIGGTLLLKVSSNPVIPMTNPLLITIFLALHFITVLSMAYACSYLVKTSQYAVSVASLSYMVLCAPLRLLDNYTGSLKLLTGLLPFVPGKWFWFEVVEMESYGKGASFGSIVTTHHANSGPILAVYVLLMLQTLAFMSLGWYLSQINPGPYGQAKPWSFLCSKSFWYKSQVVPEDEAEELNEFQDPQYFEAPPKDMHPGIRVLNVTKVFGSTQQRALTDVSLDVYRGEITVLLGHNGAGKTTLMSIISGMMNSTEGKVLVEGYDTAKEKVEMRKLLGLCPQHNLFFPDLTVLEHVKFFTMLKGGSFSAAAASSSKLLEQLGLGGHESQRGVQLSGGMRRRLQLGCALAGDARVLLLDEPTSGLDVETRRGLWDLLLSLRGSRTLLISTHFMEEADALGDRVAALHAGRLVCHATTMHLKRAIGTGYRLSLTTAGRPQEEAITRAIVSQVPEATVKEKSFNSLSYNLPADATSKFPNLFNLLEAKKSELGIETIGVGISTLEEVFLKLCSDTTTTFTDDEIDGSTEEAYKYHSGTALYVRQFMALFYRQMLYFYSKKISFMLMFFSKAIEWNFCKPSLPALLKPDGSLAHTATEKVNVFASLFADNSHLDTGNASAAHLPHCGISMPEIRITKKENVIIPIAMLYVFVLITNEEPKPESLNRAMALDLDLYGPRAQRRVMMNVEPGTDIRALGDAFPDVAFEPTGDVAEAILRTGKRDIFEYNKYLVGIEINETHANALYTTLFRHAAPVSLGVLANTLATRSLPAADGRTLVTRAHPFADGTRASTQEPKSAVGCMLWAVGVCFVILTTVINYVSLPCVERRSGTRHAMCMAGAPAMLQWVTTLAAHLVPCLVFLLLPAVLLTLLDTNQTIDRPIFLVAIFVLLLAMVLSFLSFSYLVSFSFGERGASTVLVACVIVFGLFTPTLKEVTELFKENLVSVADYLLLVVSYTMPPHTASRGVMKASQCAYVNAMCSFNRKGCAVPPVDGIDVNKCCVQGIDPRCYFCFDDYSPMKEVMILLVQFVVYMVLVYLTETGVFNVLWDRIHNYNYKPGYAQEMGLDDTLAAEKLYVEETIKLPPREMDDALLVHDVHKRYFSCFKKSKVAVKGVSFSVKKGECFGLLGVNGAGKTSTFKILAALECASRGSVFANGHFMSRASMPYLQSLGYCPQFMGLDAFLSGRDNLALLLTLRGLSREDVAKETGIWIRIVGLEGSASRQVSRYSGGMSRRLAAAASLCAGARVALLDEPTAGVDVAARRRVWAALRRAQPARAVVITSHSMDEMEALCNRISIMANGRLRALGSAAALRAQFAAGHAVRLKLAHAAVHARDETDSVPSEINQLKVFLHQKFDCSLRDEHKTMLHYHIRDTMPYSELFSELERLKISFPNLVEDYDITETTLEEVFLKLAEEQGNSV